jgi:hypothetical protein
MNIQIYILFFLSYTPCNTQIRLVKGMSLSGRSERFYHPKVRHFAIVDAILYPPKVSSKRVVDDIGTDENNRRNGSKVLALWLTLTFNVSYSCCMSYSRL